MVYVVRRREVPGKGVKTSYLSHALNPLNPLILLDFAKNHQIIAVFASEKSAMMKNRPFIEFRSGFLHAGKGNDYFWAKHLKPLMRGIWTVVLLILSNTFMTLAWYGHLRFKDMKWFENLGLIGVVLVSWGIALFEYFFQVPANRIGFKENG